MAPHDLHERLPPGERPGAAGRVLEVGDRVDEAGALLAREEGVERLRQHPVVVGRDLDEARPVGAQGVDRPEVGRALAEHDIALVEEDLAREVEALLRAARDQHLVRVDGRGERLVHVVRDPPPQRRESLARSVLQGFRA